ncbi:3-oxoacyl-ACP reductase FabG [Litoribrevibacter albus]|uniref:3-oxoacyl-[acyl-carrier-protein] reductase n=1 Tax=Litoribrevibacter albus TaxID=1473156 RepID=A0AA37SBY7_9GAMM|nr:3-oxoacyl-ACP reductase FabG [Litoribrevibacter albus]GLQ31683.1 3-oxoacyl-[acyl-carrier-protein] reductase FabG [Litoribrevibacter albus]
MSDQKVALVTGASRGIGAAIAAKLVAQGFYVIGTATSDSGAENISRALGEQGCGKALDVSSDEAVAEFFKQLKADDQLPLVVVNNAGITDDGLSLRMKESQWQRVIDTNLTGSFRVAQAALKAMTKARWGRVVNISSVVAQAGNPGQANYCAAKAGLEGMTRSLAKELANRNITFNCVAPGFIASDMTEALNDQQKDAILGQIPMGRMGNPDEIAAVVSFLSSEEASYITGQVIQVNGGMYLN